MKDVDKKLFRPMTEKHPKIAPSLLAFDFGRLADEAQRIEEAGADYLHLDIMDGHFVPNLTMGPQIVAAINRATDLFLDVHLMIYNPFDYVERFIEAGADGITFHIEATEDVEETLGYIKRCGVRAGLAINPETPLFPKYLDQADLILLMTVHPGFGGQTFIEDVLEKVKLTREICEKLKIKVPRRTDVSSKKEAHSLDIQVDGGINFENVRKCVEAGATDLVVGTTLSHSSDLKEALTRMRVLATINQDSNFKR